MELALGEPNPKQKAFMEAKERYIAYGGARGGGKSWAVRMKAIAGAVEYPGLRVLIVRRTYPELEHSIIRPLVATLARMKPPIGVYRKTWRTVEMENGSTIRFGHLAAGNLEEYQGQEYDWIFLDEATQFTEREFRILAATLRGTAKVPRRMYLTCNPGGVGHQWVKRLFIDRRFRGREKPEDYRFIPATVEDNKALLEGAPGYVEMLELLPEDIRRGHRYGDWGVFAGQYFSEFDPRLHVVKGLTPRSDWQLYRGIDYGLDMLACVWFGVDDKGRMYVYREVQEPGLVVSEAARLIRGMTPPEEDILATAAPPDLWSTQKDSGRTMEALFARGGVPLARVSSARVAGWMAVKERLRPGEDGQPGLLIDANCRGLIENLQALRYSDRNPSDCDVKPHAITHVCDALRYGCQLRFADETEEREEADEEMLGYIYYGTGGI